MNKIQSPISNFNNILIDITNNIEKILFSKNKNFLTENNLIIFNNSNITIMGYIKLFTFENKLHLKIIKPINQDEFELINNIYNNWNELSLNFFRYIQMYNNIVNNYDDIPFQFINEIINNFNSCLVKKIESDKFLIPYKNKISNLYDKEKAYLYKFYNKFEYVIKIKNNENSKVFDYFIYRVLSSELSQNKNELNNLRYLEQDIIQKGKLHNDQITNFVTKLFCYGEIIS